MRIRTIHVIPDNNGVFHTASGYIQSPAAAPVGKDPRSPSSPVGILPGPHEVRIGRHGTDRRPRADGVDWEPEGA